MTDQKRNYPKVTTRKAWTEGDIIALMALYDNFLFLQEIDFPYQKARLVRELAVELDRTKGSIEMKLMNISGVRDKLGLPYVTGYKPMYHGQKLLTDIVTKALKVAA